ncbi:MAG: NAD-binding protein [Magnetococcales bacterium]|nr:NAD-binding protein [Magnetococcales bacterium]
MSFPPGPSQIQRANWSQNQPGELTLRNRFTKRPRDLYDILGRFRPPLVALILVNTIGILGFMIIDDYPFLDAVYQTVFTLTTVGYQETHPISNPGKLFVILLILGGVMVWSYALGVTISVVVNEDLIGKIREAITEHWVKQFKDHFIIAGYTEISRQVVRRLARQDIPFVVIDDDAERLAQAGEDNVADVMPLNPFLNDSYRRAGVEHSRGIIATFAEDSDNITAVVTGKILEEELKPDIAERFLVISIANHKESRDKLRKIGADVVIMPNELIGQRISAIAIHPPDPEGKQSSFLDRVAFGEFVNLDIRDITVEKYSSLDGVAIRDSMLRSVIGAHILGIQRKGQRRLMLLPNPDIHIHAGDQVLIMGTLAQLEQLPDFLLTEQMVRAQQATSADPKS